MPGIGLDRQLKLVSPLQPRMVGTNARGHYLHVMYSGARPETLRRRDELSDLR